MHRSGNVFLIYGAGGHASVIHEIIEDSVGGAAIIRHYESCEPDTLTDVVSTLVAAAEGYEPAISIILAIGKNDVRFNLASEVRQLAFPLIFPVVRHKESVLSRSAKVGDGTQLCVGATVNTHARIGEMVIVNTNAVVEHDCEVGAAAHISPGAVLAGGVTVGRRTWIGAGAVVREGVTIGDDVIVGAGAVVLEDVPDGVVTVGVPARIIRDNSR